MFIVYNLLFPLLALAYLAKLLLSSRRNLLKTFPNELKERLGFYPPDSKTRPILWIHAASVGEARCLPKLVKSLREGPAKGARLWVTTSTLAGKKTAETLGADRVLLAPLDMYPFVKRCMMEARPKALVIVETELWPSTLRAARKSGAKVIVVNGRISERSAKGYRWVKSLLRLDRLDLACVQTELDKDRFVALGTDPKKVHIVGNLKHDMLPEDVKPDWSVMERFGQAGWNPVDPVFVAGSTHPVEEDQVLAAFMIARRELPNLRLVLAPRHVERTPELVSRLKSRALDFDLWTRFGRAADVLLVDKTGVLNDIYRGADVVFVGGSLVDKGGHNLMEPASLAKPTLFGPHVSTVAGLADLLIRHGGGFKVADGGELATTLVSLLRRRDLDEVADAAREACLSLGGATAKTLALLAPLLK